MGKENDVIIEYLSQPEVFADLFNGYVFQGKQVVCAKELEEAERELRSFWADSKVKLSFETMKKQRDIVRKTKIYGQEVYLMVCGVEHQSKIDYSMALRSLSYDTLEYLRQAKLIAREHKKNKDLDSKEFLSKYTKEDKLIPTITLIFYSGEEKWDGAMNLEEMFVPSQLLSHLAPYMVQAPLNLIWAYDVEHTERYQSSLRKVFDLLKVSKDKDAMLTHVKEHEQEYSRIDQVTGRLIQQLLQLELVEEEEEWEGEMNMCKALEDLRKEGFEEGLQEGIQEGLEVGRQEERQLVKKVFKLQGSGATPSEIAKECNITEEQVLEILE